MESRLFKRNCRACGKEYRHAHYANFYSICPICNSFDFLECEYGYGPVVPCYFIIGNEVIGIVSREPEEVYGYEGEIKYRFRSEKYNLDVMLKKKYIDAIKEAKVILKKIYDKIRKNVMLEQKISPI